MSFYRYQLFARDSGYSSRQVTLNIFVVAKTEQEAYDRVFRVLTANDNKLAKDFIDNFKYYTSIDLEVFLKHIQNKDTKFSNVSAGIMQITDEYSEFEDAGHEE